MIRVLEPRVERLRFLHQVERAAERWRVVHQRRRQQQVVVFVEGTELPAGHRQKARDAEPFRRGRVLARRVHLQGHRFDGVGGYLAPHELRFVIEHRGDVDHPDALEVLQV